MKSHSRFLVFSKGQKVRLQEWGEGSTSCVLMHGFAEGSYVWENLGSQLAEDGYHTIALDLPGHGESSWDRDRAYSVAGYVSDVEQMIAHLGLQKIILIGHSLGGNIAIHLAAGLGSIVAAAVIIDFSPQADPIVQDYIRAEFQRDDRVYASVMEYAERLRLQRPLAPFDLVCCLAQKTLKKTDTQHYVPRCDPALGWGQNRFEVPPEVTWGLMESIACPVLIVRGEASAVLSPDIADEMKQRCTDGYLRTVRRAGHAVMVDNPASLNEVVRCFIKGLQL